ncbi:S1/P1 nuclease [Microbulbifer sp. VAAF005]|uniref:S1/P1 nuclease n=1 Tax=Microbulbifer sp. VAAF005 TaxID=3034230 RepID=UPI00333E7DA3
MARLRSGASKKISGSERQLWQSTSVEVWAQESHKLAHKLAYTTEAQLGEKYFLRCQDSVEMRLQQGGVRLASVLNGTLGNPGIDVVSK